MEKKKYIIRDHWEDLFVGNLAALQINCRPEAEKGKL